MLAYLKQDGKKWIVFLILVVNVISVLNEDYSVITLITILKYLSLLCSILLGLQIICYKNIKNQNQFITKKLVKQEK
jgi:hypothetical protein